MHASYGFPSAADFVLLVHDSQYLVEGAAEREVILSVSGALDRLQHETSNNGPCIEYDPTRRVWVYLHANRRPEDFHVVDPPVKTRGGPRGGGRRGRGSRGGRVPRFPAAEGADRLSRLRDDITGGFAARAELPGGSSTGAGSGDSPGGGGEGEAGVGESWGSGPQGHGANPFAPPSDPWGEGAHRDAPPAYRDGSAGGRGYGSPGAGRARRPRGGRRGGPGGAHAGPRPRSGRADGAPFDPGALQPLPLKRPAPDGERYAVPHLPAMPSALPGRAIGTHRYEHALPPMEAALAARPPVGQVVDPRMGGAPGLPGRPLPLDPADANLEGEEEEASDSTATESDSPGRKAGARASLPHWHQWGSQASLASMGSAGATPSGTVDGRYGCDGDDILYPSHYGGAFRNGPRS
eukprot:jgi/Botrbrau1/12693/Bobra.67_1s0057.1